MKIIQFIIIKKLKEIIALLFFLIFSYSSFSQEREIDSLKNLFKNAAHDTTRLQALNEWARIVLYGQPDSVFVILTKAKTLAEKNINKLTPSDSIKPIFLMKFGSILNKFGIYYRVRNPTTSLEYYNRALKIR